MGWSVRGALYVAGLAAGGAFGVMFTGGAMPYLLGAAMVALLVGSAGAYRFLLLFPAAALYTLLAVYGAPPLSLGGWARLSEQIWWDVYNAAGIMYASPVPYDVHPGLLVVTLPVVVTVVAFATSATLYEGSPVASIAVLGLTIGVLGTVSLEAGIGPFFAIFLLAGVALLLMIGRADEETQSDAQQDARRRGLPAPAAILAGLVVVGGVLAMPMMPYAREAIRPAVVDWTRIGTGATSRLAVEADVGDYLNSGRDARLMRVESPEPLLWRGGTLDYFDGVRWSSTVEPGEDDGEEISPGVETRNVVQSVQVLEAETDLLFGGYRVTNVSLPQARERSDGSWETSSPLTGSSSYRVLSQIPQPTAAQLEGAGTDYPAEVREKFLQLPEDRPEVLAETAERIRRDYDPQNPYETARAIERYLIYDGGFTYNLDVDYKRADWAIEEFLGEGREGFCTQFATSMALLARELDIPSRVVYGATTGEEEDPNEYIVTGYNMHTWVEVYFPGVGWYTFDPTPGFTVPAAMEANAPRPTLPNAQDVLTSESPALRGQGTLERSPIEGFEDPADTGGSSAGENRPLTPFYLAPLVLLILAVPLVKRALASRGRPEDLYRDLGGRLRDALPPGKASLADSPALTPTERLLLLAGALNIGAGPFREFARAYSESVYSPDPRSSAARAYRRALAEYERLPRWRRALAAFNPASLLLRVRRGLAAGRVRLAKTLRRSFQRRP